VASLIVDGANGILGAEISAVYLLNSRAGSLRLLASQGRPASAFVHDLPMGTTAVGRAVLEGAVHEPKVDPVSDGACWLTDPASISSQSAVVLRSGEGVVGVLVVGSRRPRTFTGSELERLATVADQASLALQNALLHEELARLSVTDRLTELYNHGYFQARLEQELARARRFGHRAAVVMLDIDDFKSFNDSYGHPRGDAVLRGVSSLIQATLRDMDVAARYGGEEFVLILPETSVAGGVAFAERIRAEVAAARFVGRPGGAPVRKTVSLGVAVFADDADTGADLVEVADRAMYAAKRAGKDTVRTAERPAWPSARQEVRPAGGPDSDGAPARR
jgi:diguanylate cyclase (GGDEF)-like protein